MRQARCLSHRERTASGIVSIENILSSEWPWAHSVGTMLREQQAGIGAKKAAVTYNNQEETGIYE